MSKINLPEGVEEVWPEPDDDQPARADELGDPAKFTWEDGDVPLPEDKKEDNDVVDS